MEKYSRSIVHAADNKHVVSVQKGTGTVIVGMEFPYVVITTPDTAAEGGKPLILFAVKYDNASDNTNGYYAAIGNAVVAPADSWWFFCRPGAHQVDNSIEEDEIPLLEAIADRLLKEGKV